jgi:fermentation-respiration switch protein FrsA (DUF1100 family)
VPRTPQPDRDQDRDQGGKDSKKPALPATGIGEEAERGTGVALVRQVDERRDRYAAVKLDVLIALSYRGYGGSSGSPSEEGLIADARAAYKFAVEHYAPSRLVLWGESLGTGVAVALAAERPVGKVVLQSPFTSTVDVGAAAYWFVPVRLLMKDQFRSDERIGRVSAPVLVMHGERDRVVPFRFGERLFSLVQSDKRFVRFADGGHDSLDALGALAEVKKFIGEK